MRRRAPAVAAPPCRGFDADTAAAHLEGALTPSARVRYDEHLAACASCRRCLVELSRLMPQPAAHVTPAVTASPSAASLRGRFTSFSHWFNFSDWRWGAVAGVGAAGLAVLLAVVTLAPLPNSHNSSNIAQNMPTAHVAESSAPQPSRATAAGHSQRGAVPPDGEPRPSDGRLRMIIEQPQGQAGQSPAPSAAAQVAAPRAPATVSGKVSDATGAAVPNAEVKLIDPASQQARSTTTNEAGEFNFPNVPPARYVVEAQAPGFIKQQNVADAQDANEVVALQLRPGAVTENVQVTGETQLLKDKAEVATLSEPERTRQQRREADLLRLSPGVVSPEEKAIEVRKRAAKEGTKDEQARGGRAAEREAVADAARGDQKNAKAAGRVAGTRAMSVESREAAASKPAAPAPPTRKVGEKTFRLENGVWVDIQYRPADNLPVTRLPYSGEEFDRAAAERPGLKPFLELKPVIVVWQGRVYQVEARK
jgi:hypothetical protein